MMLKTVFTPWRWWSWLYAHYQRETTAAIALLVLLLGTATYFNDRAINQANTDRTKDNSSNAITSCENANESREASRTLWYFVVDLASRGAGPQEAAYLNRVRSWIGDVYRPHDCADLSREYVIPPPPSIPTS
jgi:hypothetical protein